MNDLVNELFVRRKNLDSYKLWDLFPQLNNYFKELKLGQVELAFPDLLEDYPFDKIVGVRLNP